MIRRSGSTATDRSMPHEGIVLPLLDGARALFRSTEHGASTTFEHGASTTFEPRPVSQYIPRALPLGRRGTAAEIELSKLVRAIPSYSVYDEIAQASWASPERGLILAAKAQSSWLGSAVIDLGVNGVRVTLMPTAFSRAERSLVT